MRNKKMIMKYRLSTLAIGLLTTSSLVMAANYDTLDRQRDNFNSLNQIAPQTTEQGHSISPLESFQQAEQSNKRANYLEVLNLIKQNKLEEAENKISSLLKMDPNVADYYNLKALLETVKKDTTAAQQSYEKAI